MADNKDQAPPISTALLMHEQAHEKLKVYAEIIQYLDVLTDAIIDGRLLPQANQWRRYEACCDRAHIHHMFHDEAQADWYQGEQLRPKGFKQHRRFLRFLLRDVSKTAKRIRVGADMLGSIMSDKSRAEEIEKAAIQLKMYLDSKLDRVDHYG